MTVTAFSQFNINCADIERALQFYVEDLGLSVFRRLPEREGTGTLIDIPVPHTNHLCFLAEGKGDTPIELIQWITGVPAEPVSPERTHLGYSGIIVRSESIDRTASRLGGRSESVLEADGRGGFVTSDPDGLLVHIVEGSPGIAGYIQNCSDLDEAIAYYVDLLDLVVERRGMLTGDWAGGRRQEGLLRISNAPSNHPYLVLREWSEPSGVGRPPSRLDALGLVRVGFVSTDVPRDYVRITQEYEGLFGGPHDARVGNLPVHFAFVRGPDDCFVEIAEHNPGKGSRKG